MIEQILVGLATTTVAVAVGSYVGAQIMRRQLKKEISGYIMNEIPHLLESKELKEKGRELARVFVRELITITAEELGLRRRTDEKCGTPQT